jgi:hypothetical protein
MTYTLIFYVLINGAMSVDRIPTKDADECASTGIHLMNSKAEVGKWQPIYAECKPRKAKKVKQA